ncbi:hypothetical protein L228DRAFT_33710 [Xylona heveae TC161]|uniref:Zn(2)-C6 fungal-type domain-containing protein n=1 Tax=Xylona heveae (strain CBS 132557 / TC161) TaxID=1328760 RepID=A0A165A6I8_XYLHT|nr:hypothetical protein L228DRAFT_33710 [Xylona heveae TC161]KZF20020.1 hypothetical protein L228DRAFT_33710 [Xylona heveae TC161]
MASRGNHARGSRTRTFRGCFSCRERKVKCDETKPYCRACRRLGIPCKGYSDASLVWLPLYDGQDASPLCATEAEAEARNPGYRRIVSSVDQRACMSNDLVTSVARAGRNVDKIQLDLDGKTTEDGHYIHGPFTVFPLLESEVRVTNSPSTSAPGPVTDDPLLGLSPSFLASWLPPDDPLLDAGITNEPISLSPLPEGLLFSVSPPNLLLEDYTSALERPPDGADHLEDMISPIDLDFPLVSGAAIQDFVPLNADFLLRHYQAQIMKLIPPIAVKKSPWQILHFPCATGTFAELSLFQKANHARISLFYSVLACSAFHLDRVSSHILDTSSYWWKMGTGFKAKAMHHLQQCINEAKVNAKSAKYKELLMAILTVITIGYYSGQHRETRSCLIGAEQLIRLRGLPKLQKSRKVVLLHHIYLYLQVFTDSTSINPVLSPPAGFQGMRLVSGSAPSLLQQNSIPALERVPSSPFEPRLFNNMGPKCTQMDEKALFSEIYALPPSLLELISQTNELAHEIHSLRSKMGNTRDITPLFSSITGLSARVKDLENKICHWTMPDSFLSGHASNPLANPIKEHLTPAFHCALVLFFHRRILDLNPIMLQHWVSQTITHLIAFEDKKSTLNIMNHAMVWPGFMAACEALYEEQQVQIAQWLDRCGASCGSRTFDLVKEVATEVWAFRQQKARIGEDTTGVSWIDLLRERGLSVALT